MTAENTAARLSGRRRPSVLRINPLSVRQHCHFVQPRNARGRSVALALRLALLTAFALAAAACSGGGEEATPEPTPVFEPTPAPPLTPIGSPTEAAAEPTATASAAGEPSTGDGDAVRGEQVFMDSGCSACHSTGSDSIVGPGFAGLRDMAGTRVAGLSAEQYVEQSIREPGEFIVEGFPNVMLTTFGDMPDDDMRDLIAYLFTLQ